MSELISKDINSYINFLPNQYSNSEKLKTLLAIFLEQAQQLDDAQIALDQVSTNINLAFGYQLDIIGKLNGIARGLLNDEDYRKAIYQKIAVNIGSGTPEGCIQYLRYMTEATKVRYWEHYPASAILEAESTNIPNNVASALDKIAMAGVKIGGVMTSDNGGVLRPCEEVSAFDNLIEGSPDFFAELEGTHAIAGSILPELTDAYEFSLAACGEPLMECGEPEALCQELLVTTIGTKGTLAEIYPYIPKPPPIGINFNLAGETLMLCGEPSAECEAI